MKEPLIPIARKGKQPVPEIQFQHIFETQCSAKVFQTDGKITKAKDNRVFFEVEPSKKEEVKTAFHIGIHNFINIGNHNSAKPRVDCYIPLDQFDEFIWEYLKWKYHNGISKCPYCNQLFQTKIGVEFKNEDKN